MAYALMALIAARELHRHIAKIIGWEPRYRPIRNHAFNALFAFSAFIVATGSLFALPRVVTVGWLLVGVALLGGMFVPCGYAVVNGKRVLWYLRQLLFLSLSIGAFAYAFGLL